ncbi:MAG: CDP-diacylglycerol--glycerol-3-phosphate 3-phosphatidyltransferase [Anaplasmataceae bacterium]|nr:CDP-diacylglycerol--glycerol-3-phosphate 3-phosphatidyltransferase [Anaplasmataceae bacterium]
MLKIFRFKNIANLITMLRIILVPLIITLLFFSKSDENIRWTAWTLLQIANASDFIDGYVARLLKIKSKFGRIFDPIADKLAVISVLLMLVYNHGLSIVGVIAVILILCREIIVSGLREYMSKYTLKIKVSNIAKAKTFLQMVAMSILIITTGSNSNSFLGQYMGTIQIVGEFLLITSALIAIISAVQYFNLSMRKIL